VRTFVDGCSVCGVALGAAPFPPGSACAHRPSLLLLLLLLLRPFARQRTHPSIHQFITRPAASTNYPINHTRYHPDRNVGSGSGEAAEKFKEISTAYAILSDPNKRRQYDLSGADANSMFESGMESVDLENLNSMMRVFGAMMTKLGVPIPTQVRPSVRSVRRPASPPPLCHPLA